MEERGSKNGIIGRKKCIEGTGGETAGGNLSTGAR